jgi:hypothetical protein
VYIAGQVQQRAPGSLRVTSLPDGFTAMARHRKNRRSAIGRRASARTRHQSVRGQTMATGWTVAGFGALGAFSSRVTAAATGPGCIPKAQARPRWRRHDILSK